MLGPVALPSTRHYVSRSEAKDLPFLRPATRYHPKTLKGLQMQKLYMLEQIRRARGDPLIGARHARGVDEREIVL